MPLRRPDDGDEDLGEGLALEVVKRQRRAKGVAGRGRGRGPETASRPISRRRIGSFVEKSFKILKRQTFFIQQFFLSRHKSVRKMFSHPI